MEQNSAHVSVTATRRTFLYVWFWLLMLTGAETFLAYAQLPIKITLSLLMGLSVIKASLILSYFMHLRYERRSLALILLPGLIFIIVLLLMFFPDSFRLYTMRPH
jgi:cytochrome c oxidase subunit IV